MSAGEIVASSATPGKIQSAFGSKEARDIWQAFSGGATDSGARLAVQIANNVLYL
jgi:hypothetical protein